MAKKGRVCVSACVCVCVCVCVFVRACACVCVYLVLMWLSSVKVNEFKGDFMYVALTPHVALQIPSCTPLLPPPKFVSPMFR